MATPPAPNSEQRVPWALWFACGLSAVGAVALVVVSGGSSRITAVVVAFGVAALAFAACCVLYSYGRPVATVLYFVASLAIVYGILGMLTLPLRLAVIGACPPAPDACTAGLEPSMTSGETSAMGLGLALGVAAILVGFFGLSTLYRRKAEPLTPSVPPVRRIAPVNARSIAPTEAGSAETVVPPAPAPPPVESEPEPERMLELASPAEALELPAVGTPDAPEATSETPIRKPRRRRAPTTPIPATPPTEGAD